MRTLLLAMITVLLTLGFCLHAFAEPVRPFYSRNLQPSVQIFGLPGAEDGMVTPAGRSEVRLVSETASHFSRSNLGTEQVFFDGETYRLTLSLRHGLAENWELGLDVPLVGHHGGTFDRFIEGWHDFFGMGQGGRDRYERNQLLYYYQKDGDTKLDYRESGHGLGDISLLVARSLFDGGPGNQRALALRAGIKLPTGDSDRLRGSGSTDAHLRLSVTDAQSLQSLKMTLFGSAGLLGMSRGEVLADQQRNSVGFGTLGLGWRPLHRLAFKFQVDGHTAFFKNSRLDEIGKASAQLMVGGSLYFGDNWTFDLGVSEDIVVGTAPDVALFLSLSRRF